MNQLLLVPSCVTMGRFLKISEHSKYLHQLVIICIEALAKCHFLSLDASSAQTLHLFCSNVLNYIYSSPLPSFQVQHLQKILAKKRDPVSHICFIEEIVKVCLNENIFISLLKNTRRYKPTLFVFFPLQSGYVSNSYREMYFLQS